MKVTVNHAYNGELRASTVEAKEMFIQINEFTIRERADGSLEISKTVDEAINMTTVSKTVIRLK